MEKEVLLIVPPSKSFRMAEEHLGVGYLGAILEDKGIKVSILDGYLGKINHKEIEKRIKLLKPKIIGFSLYQDSLASFIKIVRFAKKEVPNVHICIGGFLASLNYSWLLSRYPNLIDSIISGEGEISFLNLVNKIFLNKNWKKVKGIIFFNGQKIVKNIPQPRILNLNLIPFPLRPTIKETIYRKNPIHVCASRGCYGDCSFCAINAFWKTSSGPKWRGRSVKNIVDEIEYLHREYKAIYFKFVDDCWFPPVQWKKRALNFCRELKKRKLKIHFRLSCRANNVDYRVFREMKNCGLFSVSLGIESGVERQLKEWRKGITVKQGLSALNICRKLKIIVQMGYIMLDRNTTIKELKDHLNFLKKTKFTVTKGIYSCVFAAEGTDIAKTCKKKISDKKRGINIEYSFKHRAVKIFADNLKTWSKVYAGIYSMAIDLLSAPRAISLKNREKILGIVQRLKLVDYEILEGLINFAEKNDYLSMKYFLSEKIKNKNVFMKDIKKRLIDFYDKNGLFFEEKENLYIK